MAQELVVKVCYGIGNGYFGVLWHGMVVQVWLWHRNWLFRCIYGTGTGCSGVLWQRNRVCRCVMVQELVVQV